MTIACHQNYIIIGSKKYKIDAAYEKKLLNNNEIKELIFNIREEKIHGLNVTVPFKKMIIPFLDELSEGSRNFSIGKHNL